MLRGIKLTNCVPRYRMFVDRPFRELKSPLSILVIRYWQYWSLECQSRVVIIDFHNFRIISFVDEKESERSTII